VHTARWRNPRQLGSAYPPTGPMEYHLATIRAARAAIRGYSGTGTSLIMRPPMSHSAT
jgi:hypothetical protein